MYKKVKIAKNILKCLHAVRHVDDNNDNNNCKMLQTYIRKGK